MLKCMHGCLKQRSYMKEMRLIVSPLCIRPKLAKLVINEDLMTARSFIC
jgi:hypothetical protein